MITITLKDSMIKPDPPRSGDLDFRIIPFVMTAVAKLREELSKGKIQCFSLKRGIQNAVDETILDCFPSGWTSYNNATLPTKLLFTTSHYVGQATVDVKNSRGEPQRVRFVIQPRMGQVYRDYLIGMASNVYLPERLSAAGDAGSAASNQWLLLLMWRCAFEYAIKNASVPKAYVLRNANMRSFRGRLDVSKHIQHNLVDQSRMYCSFRPMTMDTTINQTIRYVYRLVMNADIGDVRRTFGGLAEHDTRLASFGVSNRAVTLEEIDRIVYTRMTEPYRRLMALSKIVIRGLGACDCAFSREAPAFFVDLAEIWENYLMRVFRTRMPEYRFESPNESQNKLRLLDGGRSIRPDFFVRSGSDGRLLAILDAKYKRYSHVGRTANDPHAVSRDDLYQMATYLYRFADPSYNALGLFISPYSKDGNDLQSVLGRNHDIGVCNLTMPLFEGGEDNELGKGRKREYMDQMRRAEIDFAERLRQLLKGIESSTEDSEAEFSNGDQFLKAEAR